jgi:tRNA1(Val) A37 N6-methylase TrmN6
MRQKRASSANEVTEDAVLDGRLRLRQPKRGHRVGHDAILLAAACPAGDGECVVDLGAGVGGAGLAVAARVAGAEVVLVEVDTTLASLAAENTKLNDLAKRVRAVALDVTASSRAFAAVGLPPDSVTHVLMNPPFNDPDRQRSSPDSRRRLAHAASRGQLSQWVKTAARLLRARGTLTLIWRADGLANVMTALELGFGAIAIRPLHPRPDAPAIRVIVRAVKASRAPLALLPGLVLSDEAGRPTPAAAAVLRGGGAL